MMSVIQSAVGTFCNQNEMIHGLLIWHDFCYCVGNAVMTKHDCEPDDLSWKFWEWVCVRERVWEKQRAGKVIFQWLSSLLYRHFLLWPLKITHRKAAQPGLKEWTDCNPLTHTRFHDHTDQTNIADTLKYIAKYIKIWSGFYSFVVTLSLKAMPTIDNSFNNNFKVN